LSLEKVNHVKNRGQSIGPIGSLVISIVPKSKDPAQGPWGPIARSKQLGSSKVETGASPTWGWRWKWKWKQAAEEEQHHNSKDKAEEKPSQEVKTTSRDKIMEEFHSRYAKIGTFFAKVPSKTEAAEKEQSEVVLVNRSTENLRQHTLQEASTTRAGPTGTF
jgi:hypothetical protein